MDLGETDELDYEEDELGKEEDKLANEEDELANNSVETGSQRKNSSRNSNYSGSDDQYLLIDCQEEENFFSSGTPVESACADTENVKIDAESEGNEERREQSERELSTQSNSNGVNGDKGGETAPVNKAKKKKKRFKPFKSRAVVKERIFVGQSLSSRLAERSFRAHQNVFNTLKYSVSGNQKKVLNRDFYQNKNPLSPLLHQEKNLQPLMTLKSNHVPLHLLRSFSPTGTEPRRYSLAQRRNKPIYSPFSEPSFSNNNNKLTFQTENERIPLAENSGCKKAEPNINGESENLKKTSAFEEKFSLKNKRNQGGLTENFRAVETRRHLRRRAFPDKNFRGLRSDVKFGELRFVAQSNIFLDAQNNFLKDDEKKLVSLKKEARLKRFSQDDMVRKEKIPVDSALDEDYRKYLCLEEEYFQKMTDQKLTREKFFSLKGQRRNNSNCESDQNALLRKPNIDKESLLKKRNPFEESSRASELLPSNKIKQENERATKIKRECINDKVLDSIKIDSQLMKNDGSIKTLGSAWQNFGTVKNETKSPVKFVRTFSKGFDELAFKKSKTEIILKRNRTDSSFSNKAQSFPIMEENKIESQLNGCIVKVFNIPPSTTTNDILALCCPVGVVREFKLNFPKENSVVIRFLEPASAEKFFSLYHGQKMNNYFLNVIIV